MNLVHCQDRARHRLLVCLDLQRAFLPAGRDPGAARAVHRRIGACRRLLDHAREWDWSVAHLHRRITSDPQLARPIEGLEPLPSEPVLVRDGVSAFASRTFRELVQGAFDAELVLIGFSLSASCLATVFDANDRGLKTVVVDDAVWAASAGVFASSAVEPIARALVAPYAEQTSTDQLIGARQPLRLVAAVG